MNIDTAVALLNNGHPYTRTSSPESCGFHFEYEGTKYQLEEHEGNHVALYKSELNELLDERSSLI